MSIKPYLIAPQEEGLVNNVEPWLLPDNAYSSLTNAYVWRGRVKKRWGYSYFPEGELASRLRINLGNTDANGDISVTVFGSVFAVGQMFSIGSQIFTVSVTGTPGTMLKTGATLATYNTTTGALVINGAAATTACYFYPATPVMGIRLRETSNVNFEDTVAFDTQFAYRRLASHWERLGTAVWTGGSSDFFWTVNYRSSNSYTTALWTVNYVTADQIRYIDEGSTTWNTIRPQLDIGGTRFLESAKIILGFKDRLIVLNTKETDGGVQTFKNRVRWSQNGDPTVAATSWLDDTPGKGGYNDASTQEAIISADFIKDRLIVYFERSTWELVYTGDFSLPFRWQQLNNELGVESTFSIIGFDKGVVGVGNVGVHTCNGVNVSRIDEKIPNEVYKIHNENDGPERVYGIRDYLNEIVYWTFPDATNNPTYPTQILLWNYQNNTWAFFKDSFTCFGYFQKDADLAWSQLGTLYGTWAQWNEIWGGPRAQSAFPDIIAGNQQGFTLIVNTNKPGNSQSLYITDYTGNTITCVDHNLDSTDYVLIEECQGATSTNNTVVKVAVVDEDNITVDGAAVTGTYTGGGKLTRISNIDITSKQWNPGTPVGKQFKLNYIDFLLDKTSDGEVSVDYFLDFNTNSSIQSQNTGNVLLGSNVLYTKPEGTLGSTNNQVRLWHRYFLQVEGQTIQIKIYMSDTQMRDVSISQSDFQLDGLIIYVSEEGRITGA